MPFTIVRNNITSMHTEAIINTANPCPVIGGGVDSALHNAAGPGLLEARRQIGTIAVGQAAITPAFDLHADYVIHTVGPVWQGGCHEEVELLTSCYEQALALATKYHCQSVSVPLISSGTYGFPKELALQTAVSAISSFLMQHDMMVYLVVLDRDSFALSEKLFQAVESYIDENCVQEIQQEEYAHPGRQRHESMLSRLFKREEAKHSTSDGHSASGSQGSHAAVGGQAGQAAVGGQAGQAPVDQSVQPSAPPPYGMQEKGLLCDPKSHPSSLPRGKRRLEDLVKELEQTFSEALLTLIDARGLTDPQVYKKANIDRKLFSKIRNNREYRPSKSTALALSIALELNLDETKDLIGRAGYALTHSSKFDIIVEYFILQENYNIFELNEVLFAFDQPLIGGV